MIKAAALALSREASALVSAAANSKAGALTSVDSSAVCEAAVLAALVTCVIASARRLVPGDALRTLGATRRLFGAAILRRMGLAAGAAVPEHEADLRLGILFADFDADDDGVVSRAELAAALVCLDIAAGEGEVDRLFAEADGDGDGGISLPEFLRLARAVLAANGVRVIPPSVAALLSAGLD